MTSRESRAFVSETVGGSLSFALVHPICPYRTSPRLKEIYADSCNALMSPRQDLLRHDVGAEISATEDSADAALSRRKEENPVIPPNRYFEYAPRAPARAHSPKANEPNTTI